jgi:hypothetical protein
MDHMGKMSEWDMYITEKYFFFSFLLLGKRGGGGKKREKTQKVLMVIGCAKISP